MTKDLTLQPKQVEAIAAAMLRVRDVANDIRKSAEQNLTRNARRELVSNLLMVHDCAAVEVLTLIGRDSRVALEVAAE